jgi:hypothetical protein
MDEIKRKLPTQPAKQRTRRSEPPEAEVPTQPEAGVPTQPEPESLAKPRPQNASAAYKGASKTNSTPKSLLPQ